MNQEKLQILPQKSSFVHIIENDEEENGLGFCWWVPNQKSLSVTFCNETSIHGFKFLGQEKRHMSER